MRFLKTPDAAVRPYEELVKKYACKPRMMFGYRIFFVNNNIWTGNCRDGVVIRLSSEHKEELLQEYNDAAPFQTLGGEMRDYVIIAEPMLSDTAFMRRWLEVSYGDVFSLPPRVRQEKNVQSGIYDNKLKRKTL